MEANNSTQKPVNWEQKEDLNEIVKIKVHIPARKLKISRMSSSLSVTVIRVVL